MCTLRFKKVHPTVFVGVMVSLSEFYGNRTRILIVLAVIYLLVRLAFLDFVPFMKDEGLYSVMIEEQVANPTLVMTFLGHEVGWKPPLFFWIYSQFVPFLRSMDFLSIEAVYRLPGTLFGLANVLLVFFIFEKILKQRDEAFLTALIYTMVFLTINVDNRVLTDTLCGTALFAGILFYLEGMEKREYFLLGGLLTFIAYFVKQTNAALVPIIAVGYLFENDRRKLRDPIFLVSLLAFPIAMFLFDLSISHILNPELNSTNGMGAVSSYVIERVILDNLNISAITGSLIPFILTTGVFFIASFFGMLKNWQRSITLTVWYLLIIFALVGGIWMPWYFYPMAPAIAYFSLQLFIREKNGKKVKDFFFYFTLCIVIVGSFCLGFMNNLNYREGFTSEKLAGEFLAGKDNVLIIGQYAPSIPAYKILEEKRATGSWKDFGWIITLDGNTEGITGFVKDYWINRSDVIDGSFKDMFWQKGIYRKDTNITTFDYIAITGNETFNPGGNIVFNESGVQIYQMLKQNVLK